MEPISGSLLLAICLVVFSLIMLCARTGQRSPGAANRRAAAMSARRPLAVPSQLPKVLISANGLLLDDRLELRDDARTNLLAIAFGASNVADGAVVRREVYVCTSVHGVEEEKQVAATFKRLLQDSALGSQGNLDAMLSRFSLVHTTKKGKEAIVRQLEPDTYLDGDATILSAVSRFIRRAVFIGSRSGNGVHGIDAYPTLGAYVHRT